MAEQIFEIGVKAEALYFDVFDKTTSRDHYPVRFRRLSDRLQDCALNIYCNTVDANAARTDTQRGRELAYTLKTAVISDCNKLLSLTKYSMHRKLISEAAGEEWTKKIHDVKFMTLAWRKSF